MRTLLVALFTFCAAAASATDKPPVTWKAAYSGNYTAINYTRTIKYVVIHTVEGSALGAASWFQNPSSQVSAHYIVGFQGEIYQCVKDKDIAWHAGNWTYNTQSIGIEHAGYTYQNQWTEAMYQKSAQLTAWICETYGIPKTHQFIIGHVEVPGATHTDPGPYFDWDKYIAYVNNTTPTPPPAVTLPKAMKGTADSLNVRSGPSTTNSIIGTIPAGQAYVAIAASGSWNKIYYKGNTGWAHSGYLAAVNNAPVSKVAVSTLNVRSGPSTGYAIVGTAHSPEMYVRTGVSGAWHKVNFGGAARWLHGGYVTTSTLP